MSGFLSTALTVVGAVVGIAAAVATGGALGVLAGALIAVGTAAHLGIIGGSIGSFMNSGWGTALMAAATLGSAGAAMYGQSALSAGLSQADQASMASDLNASTNAVMATDQTAIQTDTSFLQATQTGSDAANMAAANPDLAAATGTNAQSLAAVNSAPAAQGGLGAQASQAAAQQEANTAGAVMDHPGPGMSNETGGVQSGSAPGAAPANAQSAVAPIQTGGQPVAGLAPGQSMTPQGYTTDALPGSAPAGANNPGAIMENNPAGASADTASGGNGGMLSTAKDFANSRGGAAAIQGVGSAISGAAQGAAQQKQIEEMIQAQQWGNLQWQNQSQVDQLQAAAATPITVPQGYLQRAQALKGLLAGNQGIQPTPVAPGAPVSPPPVPAAMTAKAPVPAAAGVI